MKNFFLAVFIALSLFAPLSFALADINETILVNPIGGRVGGANIDEVKKNAAGTTDVREIIANVIKAALGFLGIAALVVFLVGGNIWLTSAGNAEKVKQGTQAMVWAVIGLFVIFGAYAIINLVLSGLTGKPLLP